MFAARASIHRVSARVLLFDHNGRLLLMEGSNPTLPAAGRWWFPVGGGVEDGEDLHQAARRELKEEAGIEDLELGPVVWRRSADFPYLVDKHLYQREHYLVGQTAVTDVYAAAWTKYEREQGVVLRWWDEAELAGTKATFTPEQLPELIGDIRAGVYPAEPLELRSVHVGD